MAYPKPTRGQIREAFKDHRVNYVDHAKVSGGRSVWSNGLRAATIHHTAGTNSADYLATAWSYPGANVVVNNGKYNGTSKDGRIVILSYGDCWHSGDGGPWPSIAAKNSLHLVSWGCELESKGTSKDITNPQIESVGRMLAALVDLGMPRGNIHRHADWTDGTTPVGGYPLPTLGRKIDTNKSLGFTTGFWVDACKKYQGPPSGGGYWDGVVPSYEGCWNAWIDQTLANPQAWRLACRLADMGFYSGTPQPKGTQRYPVKAVASLQAAKGWNVPQPGQYGPNLHTYLWG
jgi:hypothetical protein